MPEVEILANESDAKVYNALSISFITRKGTKALRRIRVSRRTMEEHWQAGYDDAVRSVQQPEVWQWPDNLEGVRTFDYCKKRWE
jgi:NTE family protein